MSQLSVSELYIHPIKSAAALQVERLKLDQRGPLNDRHWMVVDQHGRFMSQRNCVELALIQASVEDNGLRLQAPNGAQPLLVRPAENARSLVVEVWNETVLADDCGDAAAHWLSAVLQRDCRLVSMPKSTHRQVDPDYAPLGQSVGFADGFPILLISQASLDQLKQRLDRDISMRRFRPNIVVSGCSAHAEDNWQRLRIGKLILDLPKLCARCVIPSIDPSSGEKQPEVITTLAKYRRQGRDINFGINAIHTLPASSAELAEISVGDSVEIIA